ncbi:MAG: hypothetical protein KKF46_04045 [Nanoarchaeota archaeon]|nr:hypothetical protein [Nanoarchaeota archaeon]MBU1321506.1 hypothetical protein [Nanoarchaeota archaeon]MBU1597123.1 hypothetical protein [Nanoarchaeota archaeon]MBU2441543.1 hypothetical protein [Nanoarchaeota archaeon]
MKTKHKKHVHGILYYAPRVMGLIVGLFFLTMLFDWQKNFGLGAFLAAFLPGLIVIIAVIVFWRKSRRASIIFAALTLIYSILGWIYFEQNIIGTITVPLIIISALYILNVKSHMID